MSQDTPLDTPTSLPFERRRAPRARVAGQAMAVFSAQSHSAAGLTYVCLLDASAGGLGVLSPIEVKPGASFSLVPDTGPFPRVVGTVARCEPRDGAFLLGLAVAARKVA